MWGKRMINDSASTEAALKFALDGAYLSIGQSSPHENCPVCDGGSNGEKTFVIRRVAPDLITFRCYRASCGASGCISVSNGTLVSRQSKSERKEVTYKLGGFDLLDNKMITELCGVYNTNRLSLLASGVRVDGNTRRIMLPLYDAEGELKGYALRFHTGISYGNPKPKALTVWFDEVARIAFPVQVRVRTAARSSLIIVEDWNSAYRLNQAGIPAAAILGTGLNTELLMEVLLSGYTSIVMCLDADAKAKALQHKLRFSSMFRNFSVHLLSNLDIKDMERTEFEAFATNLKELYGNL